MLTIFFLSLQSKADPVKPSVTTVSVSIFCSSENIPSSPSLWKKFFLIPPKSLWKFQSFTLIYLFIGLWDLPAPWNFQSLLWGGGGGGGDKDNVRNYWSTQFSPIVYFEIQSDAHDKGTESCVCISVRSWGDPPPPPPFSQINFDFTFWSTYYM